MKLTEKDLAMFKTLSQSEIGVQFADYAKRVVDYIHDSRSWDDDDTKESANQAGKKVKELFVDKIRPPQPVQKVGEIYE